jgi:hypothetical protein
MKNLARQMIFIFSVLIAVPALSQGLDYGAKIEGAFPLGGGLTGTLGYGYLWWGEKYKGGNENDTTWKYGFIRPNLRAYTGLFVNRFETRLDVYPISIAGFTIGQAVAHRSQNNDDYNCGAISCLDILTRYFVETKFVAGTKDFFLFYGFRVDMLHSSDPHKDGFADEGSGLRGMGKQDWLLENSVIVGTHGFKPFNGGIDFNYTGMENTHQWSRTLSAFGNYEFNKTWSLRGKVGLRKLSIKDQEFIVGLSLNYTGMPSLEL